MKTRKGERKDGRKNEYMYIDQERTGQGVGVKNFQSPFEGKLTVSTPKPLIFVSLVELSYNSSS